MFYDGDDTQDPEVPPTSSNQQRHTGIGRLTGFSPTPFVSKSSNEFEDLIRCKRGWPAAIADSESESDLSPLFHATANCSLPLDEIKLVVHVAKQGPGEGLSVDSSPRRRC